MKTLAIFILLLLLLSGCRSYREVSVPDVVTRVVHDTVSNTKELHDSTYVYDAILPLDSTTIAKYFPQLADVITPLAPSEAVGGKGKAEGRGLGAVHLEYRLRIIHDSVYVNKVDTVPIVKTVEKVKNVRYIPPWCKWLAGIGITSILAIVLYIFIKIKPLF